jgi:hypothetical protein
VPDNVADSEVVCAETETTRKASKVEMVSEQHLNVLENDSRNTAEAVEAFPPYAWFSDGAGKSGRGVR